MFHHLSSNNQCDSSLIKSHALSIIKLHILLSIKFHDSFTNHHRESSLIKIYRSRSSFIIHRQTTSFIIKSLFQSIFIQMLSIINRRNSQRILDSISTSIINSFFDDDHRQIFSFIHLSEFTTMIKFDVSFYLSKFSIFQSLNFTIDQSLQNSTSFVYRRFFSDILVHDQSSEQK